MGVMPEYNGAANSRLAEQKEAMDKGQGHLRSCKNDRHHAHLFMKISTTILSKLAGLVPTGTGPKIRPNFGLF
jgi:hypothetical protein